MKLNIHKLNETALPKEDPFNWKIVIGLVFIAIALTLALFKELN